MVMPAAAEVTVENTMKGFDELTVRNGSVSDFGWSLCSFHLALSRPLPFLALSSSVSLLLL